MRALGLEIRAGVHTGECELADGKVAGIAVHIGARIAAQARTLADRLRVRGQHAGAVAAGSHVVAKTDLDVTTL